MNSPDTVSANGATLDFDHDVVGRSHETPVLVDFWAPWCGPCRVLGPVLDKLAEEADGEWSLVKVNTDELPALSQQAGIRGIPAVKLYVDGTVAAEFTGALPEPILRKWLADHLPSQTRSLLDEAAEFLERGDRTEAVERLEEAHALAPSDEDVRVMLARQIALDDLDRARSLLTGLGHRPEHAAVETIDRFRRYQDADQLPDSPVRDTFLSAARSLRTGDADASIELLIDVLARDRFYHDDAPRETIVALFTLLGESDPITRKHRPAFNRSLY